MRTDFLLNFCWKGCLCTPFISKRIFISNHGPEDGGQRDEGGGWPTSNMPTFMRLAKDLAEVINVVNDFGMLFFEPYLYNVFSVFKSSKVTV
jgi:hypothetical protein